MNHQETLETVYKHLIKQGKQATYKGACLYRGPDNTSCAVGCLIPDDQYDFEMELCGSIYNVVDCFPDNPFIRSLTPENIAFLQILQSIHDYKPNWESINAMNDAFERMFPNMDLSFLITDIEWP